MSAQTSLLDQLDQFVLDDVQHALDTLIRSGRRFTANDLRDALPKRAVQVLKEHSGTLGAAFRRAAKAKRIRKVGWSQSTHEAAHNRVVAEWEAV